MQNTLPCVGLVVLAGCLTFVLAPDDETSVDVKPAVFEQLPTIVIDPGHGGRDEGARSRGLVEKDLALDVARRTEQLLQSFGFRTVLTRHADVHVGLEERAALANRYDHSIFVSIHFNHSGASGATGVETFYATEKVPQENAWQWVGFFNNASEPAADNGEELAALVQTALVSRTEASNRGIRSRPLYVVRHVRAPAVLVEGGFLSNPFDARLLATPEYRDRLAAAIAEGVVRFQTKRPHAPKPTQLARASQ